jgi:hypothetical protein
MGYRPRDREQAIELTLELLATGRVRGVSPDHRPAELERLLGPGFGEGILTFSGNLLRDWGLLEAYYEREHEESPWRGTLLMGQLHRMPKPLKWRLIAGELRRLGYEVRPVPQPTLDDHYFRIRESGSEAIVNGQDGGRWWRRGHIAKISAADWLVPELPPAAYQPKAVHRTVYAATAQPERSWAGWLAKQQPEPHPTWFWWAHAAVHTVVREHPERSQIAAALHDWLLGRAEAAEVWPETDQVLMRARCAAGVPFGPLPARAGSAAPDAVIGRCLATLPLTREAAQSLPTAWRQLAPADVRRGKVTRALLQAANQLRDRATAPDLLAELAAWDDVLPRLC